MRQRLAATTFMRLAPLALFLLAVGRPALAIEIVSPAAPPNAVAEGAKAVTAESLKPLCEQIDQSLPEGWKVTATVSPTTRPAGGKTVTITCLNESAKVHIEGLPEPMSATCVYVLWPENMGGAGVATSRRFQAYEGTMVPGGMGGERPTMAVRNALADWEPFGMTTPWGDATDGIQIRLLSRTDQWNEGWAPQLTSHARQGDRPLPFDWTDGKPCQFQVDGAWLALPAGRKTSHVIDMNTDWREAETPEARPLGFLKPGKHTVRLRVRPSPAGPWITSNALTFEVLAEPPAPWAVKTPGRLESLPLSKDEDAQLKKAGVQIEYRYSASAAQRRIKQAMETSSAGNYEVISDGPAADIGDIRFAHVWGPSLTFIRGNVVVTVEASSAVAYRVPISDDTLNTARTLDRRILEWLKPAPADGPHGKD